MADAETGGRQTPETGRGIAVRISIITPCLNPGPLLADTVASVLGQRALLHGSTQLEYRIVDGGSTDGSLDAVRALADPRVCIVSERDGGMYEAVAKGLRLATGEVVAYLNAGDLYAPTAFEVVAEVMRRPEVRWMIGWGVEVTSGAVPVHVMHPYRYTRRWLERGIYGSSLPFVPQESTFWRRELIASVDLARLERFRLAGDAYLWRCFAREAEPFVVSSYLGAFRRHPGQLSEDRTGYRAEMRMATTPPTLADRLGAWLERPLWHAPRRVKKAFNRHHFLEYDHGRNAWT